MTNEIKNLKVHEEKAEMHVTFTSVSEKNKENTLDMFKQIARNAIPSGSVVAPKKMDENGWHNVDHNFDARLVKEDGRSLIELREKNNPPGAIILTVAPAKFLEWELIERSEMEKMDMAIRNSESALQRKNNLNLEEKAPKR